ncbi:MAG: amidohydrolase family protein [Actinomycetota bacterium]|nr:amidohydrolase family protein [Actinomycetota bacterium]
MPYATGRVYHDADSHIMETADWLRDRLEARFRDRVSPFRTGGSIGEDGERTDWASATCPLHLDPDYRAAEDQVTLRKNYYAVGSFERDHRSEALDQLGFASQLVFNTFSSSLLESAEHGDDLDLAYALADAHNRGMTEFCEVDPRLLAVGYVALADFDRAADQAGRAIEMGCQALLVASSCPANHSPSHVGLDRVWAQAAEARVPVVFHVGGGGRLLDPMYFRNGLPAVPDFHGGAENFRSVDYLAIPYPVMQTVGTMILDGVLDRHPGLRIGIIEQGASWVPGWMRYLDSSYRAFMRNEERLQNLSAAPSEIVRRQVRVTPYPHEDTGWIIANTGPEVCLFSSDYPHVEGGRNPLKRFDDALIGRSDDEIDRFYARNMADLMGPHIPEAVPAG